MLSRASILQLGLLLGAFIPAWLYPVPTLLGAFALLGPLHFSSEISWLEQRGFFLQASTGIRWSAVSALALLAAVICARPVLAPAGILLGLVVTVPLALALGPWKQGAVGVLILLGFTALAAAAPAGWVLLGVWLPTLVHVVLFTAAFMARGALRDRDHGFLVVFGVFALGIGLCALSAGVSTAPLNNVTALAGRLPTWMSSRGAFRLLAFVYTAHYLNWFSKTRVLGWHRNRAHLAVVLVAWAGSVSLFLWSYEVGLRTQLFLSLLHVLLELPLNALTFRELAQAVRGNLRARQAVPES